MEINLFGITLHLYGFILGLSAVVGLLLVEKRAKEQNISSHCVWTVAAWVLAGGLVAARLWHVITDFDLYIGHGWRVLAVWDGGMSIIGGILGGLIALVFAGKWLNTCRDVNLWQLADLAIFGLPAAQCLGRLGNYVNYELFGLPTALPWKLFIPLEYRPIGYEAEAYYHPLFAYEMVLTGLFAVGLWWYDQQVLGKEERREQVGKGNYFLVYLAYYSIGRFFLDFLRTDRAVVSGAGLGINQIFLLVALIVVLLAAVRRKMLPGKRVAAAMVAAAGLGVLLVGVIIGALAGQQSAAPNSASKFSQKNTLSAPEFRNIQLGDALLHVEIAQTPEQITRGLSGRPNIGSDGLLFILPGREAPFFWMKDMQFNLDMVWIDQNQVVGISKNVPKPPSADTPDPEVPRVSPGRPAEMVLEIAAGDADRLGIEIGDRLSW